MSTIDLKHATVTLRDGSGLTAVTGATIGANATTGGTTLTLTGASGVIGTGRTFTITGETGSPTHTVTTHTETGGVTTSITFTTALASDVTSGTAITVPASGTANTLEIRIGAGNLSFTEKRNMEYRLDRGLLDTVREGDQAPMEVSFDFEWEFLKSDSGDPPTPVECLKQIGGASDWVTSSDDTCEPYALDIDVLYHPPCGGVKDELITFEDFRWESLDYSLKDGQISCKGSCNRTQATVVRQSA